MSCDLPSGHRCVGGFHSRSCSRAEVLADFYTFYNVAHPTVDGKRAASLYADRYQGRDVIYCRCPRAILERTKRKMRALQGASP